MSGYFDGRNGRLSKTWRFRRSDKSVKTSGDLRDLRDLSSVLGDLLEVGLLPFYLASFEESPESYLAPSRGAVWGYPAVGTIHGASGVCMRCMRRYGSA